LPSSRAKSARLWGSKVEDGAGEAAVALIALGRGFTGAVWPSSGSSFFLTRLAMVSAFEVCKQEHPRPILAGAKSRPGYLLHRALNQISKMEF